MTREEARKAAEIMLAYANGETIEFETINGWEESNDTCGFNWDFKDYRVKPKEKFDPKTLKPFDKVITKCGDYPWKCDIFSYYMKKRTEVSFAIVCRKIISMISVSLTTMTPSTWWVLIKKHQNCIDIGRNKLWKTKTIVILVSFSNGIISLLEM